MQRKPMSVEQRRVHRFRMIVLKVSLFIAGLILSVLLGLFVVHFFGIETVVIDQSMASSLASEDVLLINSLSYKIGGPGRNDVVAVRFGEASGSPTYIRRIIGLPNETIRIEEGVIYVNDEPLKIKFNDEAIEDAGVAENEITLGEDEYFVLCDNYNQYSDDSRLDSIGTVDRSQIVGRAWFRWRPISRIGFVK